MTLPQAEDIYELDASAVDNQILTLNSEGTFAVLNRWGDISSKGTELQGIFHRGTRYVSKMHLKVNKQRPTLLSPFIREDNEMLSVDLTNSEQLIKGVSASTLHIQRQAILNQNKFIQRVRIKNFNAEEVSLKVQLDVDADFKDIFELRGFERKSQQGKIVRKLSGGSIYISYASKDSSKRQLLVKAQNASAVTEQGFEFDFTINSRDTKELEFQLFLLSDSTDAIVDLNFEKALYGVEYQIHELENNIGSIYSNNEHFNHWFNRSRVDLTTLLTPHDGNIYPNAGVPWYNTVFGRDGLITALQTLSFAPFVAEGVLKYLAAHQASHFDDRDDSEPGKILHEVREGELANLGELPFKKYYGSVDSTPLFVWLAGKYFERTGRQDQIAEIWPQIKLALRWIDDYGDLDGDGFVEYHRRSKLGLDNQGWKDSYDSISDSDGNLLEGPIALCEVQGYVYQAKKMGSKLAKVMGEEELSRDLMVQAKELKKKFNEIFWSEEQACIALALDGEKRPSFVLSSNMGQCLATEIVDREKTEVVAKKLFSEELYSGWGIRTLGSSEVRYNPMSYHNGSIWPHDNSLIAYGLSLYNKKEELSTLINSIFDSSLFLDLQRIPELFCGFNRSKGMGPTLYPVACSPQAWAVGTVFLLITATLGIEINAVKKVILLHSPSLPSFLNVLQLNDIHLDTSQRCGLRFVKHSNDVLVEASSLPREWSVLINK